MEVVKATCSISVYELFPKSFPPLLPPLQKGNINMLLCSLGPFLSSGLLTNILNPPISFSLNQRTRYILFFLTVVDDKHMRLLTLGK